MAVGIETHFDILKSSYELDAKYLKNSNGLGDENAISFYLFSPYTSRSVSALAWYLRY